MLAASGRAAGGASSQFDGSGGPRLDEALEGLRIILRASTFMNE